MEDNKAKKCGLKCITCENYDRENDFCKEKAIEFCSKQMHIEFAKCDDYLIREGLVMF